MIIAALIVMAAGTYLAIRERHIHVHIHEPIGQEHSHLHKHEMIEHKHLHTLDLHHIHTH